VIEKKQQGGVVGIAFEDQRGSGIEKSGGEFQKILLEVIAIESNPFRREIALVVARENGKSSFPRTMWGDSRFR
jgi:hypothetical protein